MSRELVKGAKRTNYDADTRRMSFIMPDQAAAASWHAKTILFRGKRLQLLCPATIERDDITASSLPATSTGRHQLHYQLRVLLNEVEARTVQSILASSVSCAVTLVSRGCSHGAEAYDSNFLWQLSTWCYVPNDSSWLHTTQHPTRRSSSTIFVPFNAFPVFPAIRHITRVLSVVDAKALFKFSITENLLVFQ